jgi:hypothetical protein
MIGSGGVNTKTSKKHAISELDELPQVLMTQALPGRYYVVTPYSAPQSA